MNVRSLVTPKNNNNNNNANNNNTNILAPTSPTRSMNNLPRDEDRKHLFQIAGKHTQLIRKSSRFLHEESYQSIRQATLSNPSIDIPIPSSSNNNISIAAAYSPPTPLPDSLQPDRIRPGSINNY